MCHTLLVNISTTCKIVERSLNDKTMVDLLNLAISNKHSSLNLFAYECLIILIVVQNANL